MTSSDASTREQLRQFTKDELIDYIVSVEFMLRWHPPTQTILEIRLKKIDEEIDKNLKETDALIEAVKNERISDVQFRTRIATLRAEWHRLYEKRDRTENKLYP